jgi:hypothetical protein
MLFSVPVHFKLTATRNGGERKQSTQAWSLIDFEIPDMADEDVPVVLEWKQDFHGLTFTTPFVQESIGPSPSKDMMCVRKLGETFFTPVMRARGNNAVSVARLGEDAEFLTGRSVERMLSNFEDRGVFATTLPTEPFQRRLRNNGGDGFVDFESVEHHDLDRQVASIRENLKKIMLIDGVFYQICPEPTVSLFRTEVQDNNGVKTLGTFVLIKTHPRGHDRIDSRGETFQIEDYASALAKAKKANSKSSHRNLINKVNESLAPNIDPLESIYGPDLMWMRKVNRSALSIVSWVGTQAVRSIPEELYTGYVKLYKALQSPEDDDRFDRMAEAFSRIADICKDDVSHLENTAIEALEILDARPVSVSIPRTRVLGM